MFESERITSSESGLLPLPSKFSLLMTTTHSDERIWNPFHIHAHIQERRRRFPDFGGYSKIYNTQFVHILDEDSAWDDANRDGHSHEWTKFTNLHGFFSLQIPLDPAGSGMAPGRELPCQ